MKITLINPPVDLEKLYGTEYLGCRGEQAPLGLCYLAAVLEEGGHIVRIIDAELENLTYSEIIARIKRFNTDIVGLTCVTSTLYNTIKVAKKIREYDKDILIIIGGPHASAMPESTISLECFDIGIIGEGELTIVDLIDGIVKERDLKTVRGIIFEDGGSIIKTHPRELIRDLDSLPLPARHLLPDLRKYIPYSKNYRRLPCTTMITSRGCPYGCIFCDQSVFGRHYRQNSSNRVIEEIEVLVNEYGINEIFFTEDTFTIDKKRVEEISRQICERDIDVVWRCCTRVNLVSKDLLKNMKSAGCWHIFYGVESSNKDILNLIEKRYTPEQIKNAIKWADEVGLFTQAAFMLNHPSETYDSIEETIRFAKSLPLAEIAVLMMTPMPNTKFRRICKEYGSFDDRDLTKINSWQPVFIPHGLTREYLSKRRQEFYREFFFRPGTLWRNIKHIRSWTEVKRYLNRIGTIKTLFKQKFTQ